MSTRVHSNVGHTLNRRLPQQFAATKALGTTDPNALTGGPNRANAMGLMRHSGVVSFAHDAAAALDITVWYWSDTVFKGSAGAKGWVHLGAVAAEYQKTAVDPYSAASVTAPEGALLFFQGSAAANNFYMGGAQKYDGNANADL